MRLESVFRSCKWAMRHLTAASTPFSEVNMRTPQVSAFIREVTGGSSQDLMIGAEICVATGLASRRLRFCGDLVIMSVQATAELQDRLIGLSAVPAQLKE